MVKENHALRSSDIKQGMCKVDILISKLVFERDCNIQVCNVYYISTSLVMLIYGIWLQLYHVGPTWIMGDCWMQINSGNDDERCTLMGCLRVNVHFVVMWWVFQLDCTFELDQVYWVFDRPRTVVSHILAINNGVKNLDVGICEVGPSMSSIERMDLLIKPPQE